MLSGFAIQAYKNGILDLSSSNPPTNLQEIREQHTQPHATASPPESAYNDYVDRAEGADNEATMVFEVGGKLLKEYLKGYKRVFNHAFTGFPAEVGFNNSLSAPQPNFVEGVRMQEYCPFRVDEHVGGAVLYKDNPGSITLPHLAREWKRPRKDMVEARLQSAYDGAALVYARNQALSYLGISDPPGRAKVTTFTADGTTLNLYAHYAARSEDGKLEYHQYSIQSTNLTNSHQRHKDNRKGLRNEQDRTRKLSYALKDQLKWHWKQQHRGSAHQQPPTAKKTHLDDIPEEPAFAAPPPFPPQESNPHPDDNGEVEEPPPPARSTQHKRASRNVPPARGTDHEGEAEEPPPQAKSTRHKRASRSAPPARGTDDDSGYRIIDRPLYAPTPPRSSEERRRPARLSDSHQLSLDDFRGT